MNYSFHIVLAATLGFLSFTTLLIGLFSVLTDGPISLFPRSLVAGYLAVLSTLIALFTLTGATIPDYGYHFSHAACKLQSPGVYICINERE